MLNLENIDGDAIIATEDLIHILDTHGVRTKLDPEGTVFAWEESATIVNSGSVTAEATYRDSSEWVPAPTTWNTLIAWLGY